MQIEDYFIKKDGKWVRRDNKNLKPHKKICYAKEACISKRPNYGNLLFPVCPVLRDILIDKPLYDISKIETTNSPLLDSVNRVRYVLRKLIELKPDEETIVKCAHTKGYYNRNFLTEWLKPIDDDLKTLPEKMQDNFPATSEKLAKLIKELKAVVDSHTIYSRTDLFLQFPSYLFGNDDYGFSVWRSQLTSSKPYGIVDEGGSNKEPDALVCASKSAFACTYPIDAIEASRPICEELEEVAKHLDREKTVSSKAVVNAIPQDKAEQLRDKEQQAFSAIQPAAFQTVSKRSFNMKKAQGLKTLGDYRRAAKESLFGLSLPPQKTSTSPYVAIKTAMVYIRGLISYSRYSNLLTDPWDLICFPNTEYEMKNKELFYSIKLMEFAIKYQGVQSIYELYPNWPKRTDANISVFACAGISYLEAAFDFVREWGRDIIGNLQNPYMKYRKESNIVRGAYDFLNNTPRVDDLEINPIPDTIIKTWFDDIVKGTQRWIEVNDLSKLKVDKEFNSLNKQLEHEWNRWKKQQGRDGSSETDNIAIDDKELTILAELAEGSDKTYSQIEIHAATSIPRGTIKDKLPRLENIGLIHRPLGKRKGYQITDKGREIAKRNE
jgi:DNA-binding MarR family transcriptional regulator